MEYQSGYSYSNPVFLVKYYGTASVCDVLFFVVIALYRSFLLTNYTECYFSTFCVTLYITAFSMLTSVVGRQQFRDGLKTHLFLQAYTSSSENFSFQNVFYLLIMETI